MSYSISICISYTAGWLYGWKGGLGWVEWLPLFPCFELGWTSQCARSISGQKAPVLPQTHSDASQSWCRLQIPKSPSTFNFVQLLKLRSTLYKHIHRQNHVPHFKMNVARYGVLHWSPKCMITLNRRTMKEQVIVSLLKWHSSFPIPPVSSGFSTFSYLFVFQGSSVLNEIWYIWSIKKSGHFC